MSPAEAEGPPVEGWFPHAGGPCPVATGQNVRVRYRNGVEAGTIEARERRGEAWGAEIGKSEWDIVEWQIVTSKSYS